MSDNLPPKPDFSRPAPPPNWPQPPVYPGMQPPPAPGMAPQGAMPPYRMTRSKSSFWKVAGVVVMVGVIGFNLLLFMAMFGGFGGGYDPHGLTEHTRKSGSQDKIAVIEVSGIIMESEGSLFSGGSNPVAFVHDCLNRARTDETVKAVIIEVNSPGGGITASDLIHHEIVEFKKVSGKPVIIYMKDLAASGGYYIAAPCDVIVANRTTLTGSIGVIMQNFNFHGTLTEIIKGRDMTIKAGANKDMGSMFGDPESAQAKESRRLLQQLVDEMHTQFKQVVKDGRGSRLKPDWEKNCDGRILSAQQALELGMVDKIGYFDAALSEAKRLSGATDPEVIEYGRQGGLAALFGAKAGDKTLDAESLVAQALAGRVEQTLRLYPGKPLALWVP